MHLHARHSSRFGAPLLLLLSEAAVEPVEALVPKSPIPLKPGVDICQRFRPDSAWAALRIAAAHDEAGRLQNTDVFRHGASCHLKGLGELRDGGLAGQQSGENGASRGIGERGKCRAELIMRHIGTAILWN